jgi:hypothetical protein
VEVWDRQQFGLTRSEPFPRSGSLAFVAMPVATGNGELTITCLMGKFRNGELSGLLIG